MATIKVRWTINSEGQLVGSDFEGKVWSADMLKLERRDFILSVLQRRRAGVDQPFVDAIVCHADMYQPGSDWPTRKLKGVVLAGGLGTRLAPLTKITNKHLLPVYDKPMVYYPIQRLVEAGIDEVILVVGGSYAGDFLQLLGNGHQLGLKKLHYVYQQGEGGIAAALSLACDFVEDDWCVVVLGDNIFENPITSAVESFKFQDAGARVLLKEVDDPTRFGVAKLGSDGKIIEIVEKPAEPVSNLAVTGVYMYDNKVWDMLKGLVPSSRGELEITDVNNLYLEKGRLEHDLVQGWWTDAGTHDSLLKAGQLVAKKQGFEL